MSGDDVRGSCLASIALMASNTVDEGLWFSSVTALCCCCCCDELTCPSDCSDFLLGIMAALSQRRAVVSLQRLTVLSQCAVGVLVVVFVVVVVVVVCWTSLALSESSTLSTTIQHPHWPALLRRHRHSHPNGTRGAHVASNSEESAGPTVFRSPSTFVAVIIYRCTAGMLSFQRRSNFSPAHGRSLPQTYRPR